jgi:hypothetical protein
MMSSQRFNQPMPQQQPAYNSNPVPMVGGQGQNVKINHQKMAKMQDKQH